MILVANPEQSQAALDEWLILINDQMIVAVNQNCTCLIGGFYQLLHVSDVPAYFSPALAG